MKRMCLPSFCNLLLPFSHRHMSLVDLSSSCAVVARVSSFFEGRACFLLLSRRFFLLRVWLRLSKLRVSSKVRPVLLFGFTPLFLAMVNILRITRSADREAGASVGQPEGDAPQVD